MLHFNPHHVFAARGITNPYAFLVKAGIPPNTASQIARKDAKVVKFTHLETMCLALNCAPHDLMEWQPSDKGNVSPDHPLHALERKEEDAQQLSKAIKTLPLNKLKQVTEFINNMQRQE